MEGLGRSSWRNHNFRHPHIERITPDNNACVPHPRGQLKVIRLRPLAIAQRTNANRLPGVGIADGVEVEHRSRCCRNGEVARQSKSRRIPFHHQRGAAVDSVPCSHPVRGNARTGRCHAAGIHRDRVRSHWRRGVVTAEHKQQHGEKTTDLRTHHFPDKGT